MLINIFRVSAAFVSILRPLCPFPSKSPCPMWLCYCAYFNTLMYLLQTQVKNIPRTVWLTNTNTDNSAEKFRALCGDFEENYFCTTCAQNVNEVYGWEKQSALLSGPQCAWLIYDTCVDWVREQLLKPKNSFPLEQSILDTG